MVLLSMNVHYGQGTLFKCNSPHIRRYNDDHFIIPVRHLTEDLLSNLWTEEVLTTWSSRWHAEADLIVFYMSLFTKQLKWIDM